MFSRWLVCLLLFLSRPIHPLLAFDSPFCLSLPRVSITAMHQVHQAPDAYMRIVLFSPFLAAFPVLVPISSLALWNSHVQDHITGSLKFSDQKVLQKAQLLGCP